MAIIKKILVKRSGEWFETSIHSQYYGTCTTTSENVSKLVTLTDFILETGTVIYLKFTNSNTASNPTLNINSTGAKAIYDNAGNVVSPSLIEAGVIYQFIYDGTNYVLYTGNILIEYH